MFEITEKEGSKRADALRMEIAKAINRLETPLYQFKYGCEKLGWNDDVAFVVEDAIREFGKALATLTVWDIDLSKDK